jgi:hypothetical protein
MVILQPEEPPRRVQQMMFIIPEIILQEDITDLNQK